MAKKREINKEVHYKNIINKQKSIIKDLKKKAGRADKQKEKYSDVELELMEQLLEEETNDNRLVNNDKCPECGKGTLEIVDLKIRKMLICSYCNYRQIKK